MGLESNHTADWLKLSPQDIIMKDFLSQVCRDDAHQAAGAKQKPPLVLIDFYSAIFTRINLFYYITLLTHSDG